MIMKQYIIRFFMVSLMLLGSTTLWADKVVIVVNDVNYGTVVADEANPAAGANVTLTVTPADGYYIEKSDIVVIKTIAAENATTRTDPGFNVPLDLTNDDPADLSTARTYKFTMPADANYSVKVTATFKARTTITAAMIQNIASQTYTGAQITPTVTVKDGSTTLTLNTDYTVDYGTNIYVATDGSVTVTGISKYKGNADKTFTITKAASSITTNPTGAVGLIYNGADQQLLTAAGVAEGGTIHYSLDNSTFSTDYTTIKAKAAGSHTIYYKVVGDDNHNNIAATTLSVDIAKKEITISGIQAKNKEWDGTTAATLDYTNVVYGGIEAGDALTITATGTFADANLGTNKEVTITALTLGGTSIDNYKLATGGQQETTNADIVQAVLTAEKLNNKITLSSTSLGYTGNPIAPTVTITGMTEGTDFNVKYKKGTAAATATKPTDYGTYTIVIEGIGNYTGEVVTNKTFQIDKAAATLTEAPTPKTGLVYNGSLQELLATAGTCEGGTMQYSTDGSNYKATIPSEKNAKTYTVYYKVKGDDNHGDTEAGNFTVTIAKKDVTVSGIKANDKEWDNTTEATFDYSEVVFSGIVDGDKLTVTATGTFADANVGEGKKVTISSLTLGGTSADNYQLAAEGQQTTATADITLPTSITYKDEEGNTWTVEIVTDKKGNPSTKNEVIVTSLPASVLNGEEEVPATLTGSDGKTYTIKGVKDTAFTGMAEGVIIFLPEGVSLSAPVTNVIDGDSNCSKLVLTNVEHFEASRSFTAAQVEYKRTVTTGDLFTVCLPYDLAKTADMKAYTLKGEDGKREADFKEFSGKTLKAYEPYLVSVSSVAASRTRGTTGTIDLSKSSVTISATGTDQGTKKGNLEFLGTVKGLTNAQGDAQGAYTLQADGSWKVTASTDAADASKLYVKAFNAYLKHSDGTKTGTIITDTSGYTAIQGIHTTDLDGTEQWYDLNGRRLDAPQKGITIIRTKDGKTRKVVTK